MWGTVLPFEEASSTWTFESSRGVKTLKSPSFQPFALEVIEIYALLILNLRQWWKPYFAMMMDSGLSVLWLVRHELHSIPGIPYWNGKNNRNKNVMRNSGWKVPILMVLLHCFLCDEENEYTRDRSNGTKYFRTSSSALMGKFLTKCIWHLLLFAKEGFSFASFSWLAIWSVGF